MRSGIAPTGVDNTRRWNSSDILVKDHKMRWLFWGDIKGGVKSAGASVGGTPLTFSKRLNGGGRVSFSLLFFFSLLPLGKGSKHRILRAAQPPRLLFETPIPSHSLLCRNGSVQKSILLLTSGKLHSDYPAGPSSQKEDGVTEQTNKRTASGAPD